MSLDNYQTASFRGVPFPVGSLDTSGGRKKVVHEFVNSDRRTIEDLGLIPNTFAFNDIKLPTHDNFSLRDRLKEALDASGPGELVHPTFGTFTVDAMPYTISERTSEVGIARFTMLFERSDAAIFPAQTNVKSSLIKKQSDDTLDSIETDIEDNFESTTASNYEKALEKLNSIGDSFNKIGQTVSAITSDISTYTATVTTFISGITANILAPAELARSIKDTFLQLDVLANNVENQFKIAKQLFNFGGNDPEILRTTVSRIQRADNQQILNDAMSSNALALAYNNAANIDYGNELDVQETRKSLEDEYQRLIEDTNLSSDTLNLLQELRNTSRIIFEDISVTVPKIRNITINEIPMSILAYQYYGSTDITQELIDLNAIKDVSFVSGDIQILTP